MLTLFSTPKQQIAQCIAMALCMALSMVAQTQAVDKTLSTGDSTSMKKLSVEVNKQAKKTTTEPAAVDKYSDETPESISRVEFDGEILTFTVISNGCTRAEHFSVKEDIVDGQCQLTIVRDKPDFCRRAPLPVDLSISWQPSDTYASKEIIITNPLLTAWQGKLPRLKADD